MAILAKITSVFLGGGSLALFLTFWITGPFATFSLEVSPSVRLAVDALLSMIFFVQHSGMVRASFRDRLALLVQRRYHPAIYSIASGIALILVVLVWQPVPETVYRLRGIAWWISVAIAVGAGAGFAWAVYVMGAYVDPFGLKPLRGEPSESSELIIRGPYRWMRHPLYSFAIALFWTSTDVSQDRLLFNVLWTAWIVLGAKLEERNLITEFGEEYRRYQRAVPMLVPIPLLEGRIRQDRHHFHAPSSGNSK